MNFFTEWLAKNPELRQIALFYQENVTVIDFIIVIFGGFLLLFQLNLFLFNTKHAYFRKAQKIPLYTKKQEIYLSYISGSIELLPFLGILGTVLGLMKALFTLKLETHPTITMMATAIAPALSTTLMGLIFATLNLFFFNVLKAYFEEIYARFNLSFNEYASQTLIELSHFLNESEKEQLKLVLSVPNDARIYDEKILELIEKVQKEAEKVETEAKNRGTQKNSHEKTSIVATKETSMKKKGTIA